MGTSRFRYLGLSPCWRRGDRSRLHRAGWAAILVPLAVALAACNAPIGGLSLPTATPAPASPTTPPPPATAPASPTPHPPTPTLTPTAAAAQGCPVPAGAPPLDLGATLPPPETLAAYLNQGGDPQALAAALEAADMALEAGVVQADVNGDGALDVAVALKTPGNLPEAAPGRLLVYLCGADGYLLALDRQAPAAAEGDFGAPILHAAQDLTGDGTAELLVGWGVCGASTCFERLEVLAWRAGAPVDLMAGTTDDLPFPEVRLGEPMPDGSRPILVEGTGFGSVGAGPPRPLIRTFAWDPGAGAFVLAGEEPGPSNFRVHVLHDADRAARDGDHAAALSLYDRVINDDTLDDWFNGAQGRQALAGYAGYRKVVSLAALGDKAGAQAALSALQAAHPPGDPGAPYVGLAQAFWAEFDASGDLPSACAAARAYAAEHEDELLTPLYYGYGNPVYEVEDLCPY